MPSLFHMSHMVTRQIPRTKGSPNYYYFLTSLCKRKANLWRPGMIIVIIVQLGSPVSCWFSSSVSLILLCSDVTPCWPSSILGPLKRVVLSYLLVGLMLPLTSSVTIVTENCQNLTPRCHKCDTLFSEIEHKLRQNIPAYLSLLRTVCFFLFGSDAPLQFRLSWGSTVVTHTWHMWNMQCMIVFTLSSCDDHNLETYVQQHVFLFNIHCWA